MRGWRLGHGSGILGRPDIVFEASRTVVFLDGCFWHGCRRCRSLPRRNRNFWREKIAGNVRRDRSTSRRLRDEGWKVVRIWEHEIAANPHRALARVMARRGGVTKRPASGN